MSKATKTIYIFSQGGYRNIAPPQVFYSLKDARKAMRNEYESIIDDLVSDYECDYESREYWDLVHDCRYEDDFAEIYHYDMDCDEPWTGRIDKVKIEI